jgi:hypothetical protein
MMHPSTELRLVSDQIGSGVFATRFIPRGTITWAQCALDHVLSPAAVHALGAPYRPLLDRYAYRNGRGDHVLCWDLGRYMNHSCRPAVLSPGFDIDVAVRDVEAGEELTCEYGLLNLDGEMACSCGAEGCRRTVRPDDHRRYLSEWDEQVRAAFRHVRGVEQPLWDFLRQREEIVAASRGEREVPSCGVHVLAAGSAPTGRQP